MSPGDVVLALFPDVGPGPAKWRPAVYLVALPGPYQTMLVCGVSTKLHAAIPDWDELIVPGDPDFTASGLRKASIVRLSFLRSAGPAEVRGPVGRIDPARLHRLRTRLADTVRP